jgi:type II secretory pathway pseudopilin PulG
VVHRVLSRLRADDGFGIIELSIAMVMLNIGILAIVAAFNSGAVTLARSSKIANATVIADSVLEKFRGYRNCQIYVDTTTGAGDATYTSDPALAGHTIGDEITAGNPSSGTQYPPIDPACTTGITAVPVHDTSYTGPDNRTYIVDVYVLPVQVTNGGWQKQVTVVVRDPANSSGSLVRESSTYDPFDAP